MMELAVSRRIGREAGAARLVTLILPILGALLVVRFALCATFDLLPDESFYWLWTRHLSGGYFDHPPMIAYFMWASTHVLGNTELGVRLPCLLVSLGSVFILFWLARRLLNDDRAAGYVSIMWLVSPLIAGLGMISTPDTPAIFFSVCALACAATVVDGDDRRIQNEKARRSAKSLADSFSVNSGGLWLLFGVFCGLALLAKYTAVLLPAAVVFSLLWSRRGRVHLRQPWIYLSGVLALLIFSPVIYWNATHHWASFLFQLHHGAGDGIADGARGPLQALLYRSLGFSIFVGGQALLWTPVLFVVALVVLYINWRRFFRLRDSDRLLLCCGTLPLVLFGWAATRSHGEMNWPAFAYFPISILIARYMTENWAGIRVHFVGAGCKVAIWMSAFLHLLVLPGATTLLARIHIPIPHVLADLHGWREFGRKLSADAAGKLVVCNRHSDAGEAEFYMPGQPHVWCESVGSRPTAFDYFDRGRPDYAKIDKVLFVGSHVQDFMETFNYTKATILPSVEMPGPGKQRSRLVTEMSR